MQTSLTLPGESDAEATVPYRDRRRHLQSADADGEGAEIIDATDDPADHRRVLLARGAATSVTLCETNGYENAVRPAPFQTRTLQV